MASTVQKASASSPPLERDGSGVEFNQIVVLKFAKTKILYYLCIRGIVTFTQTIRRNPVPNIRVIVTGTNIR